MQIGRRSSVFGHYPKRSFAVLSLDSPPLRLIANKTGDAHRRPVGEYQRIGCVGVEGQQAAGDGLGVVVACGEGSANAADEVVEASSEGRQRASRVVVRAAMGDEEAAKIERAQVGNRRLLRGQIIARWGRHGA